MKPSLSLEKWYRLNASCAAGIDEAGRGPLAGPVVAASVILDKNHTISELNDSKKLSPKKRELLYDQIIEGALVFGVGIVPPKQIDEINILRASLLAMKLSFDELQAKADFKVTGALIDGNQKAPLCESVMQWTVVGGDSIWPVIMAASILAKVTRDRIMHRYALEYPEYGFEGHKGYPTVKHIEALRKYGPTPIHRRSFAPLRQAGESNSTKYI